MKAYPPCPGCSRAMVSRGSHVPAGMVRYGGHGLCNACLNRMSHLGVTELEPTLPFDARPWVEQAACAETDGDLFFPEKGGAARHQVRAAKAVCEQCPVTAACLDYSLANDEVWGVWGGRTPTERFKLRRTA